MICRVVVAGVLLTASARAQDVIKPYILFNIDTSGSMAYDVCGSGPFPGLAWNLDATAECANLDAPCSTCPAQGCDNGITDDSRLWKVRKATAEVVNSFGEATYALARYHQDSAPSFTCPSGGWEGSCEGGDILVPFGEDNHQDLLDWVDYCDNWPTRDDCDPVTNLAPGSGCELCPDCGGGCDKELRPMGLTPIAASLRSVEDYLLAVREDDPAVACRPYVVIALTDGEESCGGDPVAAASSICDNLGVPVYVVGFASEHLRANLDQIADAGCDTACNSRGCRDTAAIVDNETDLALVFAEIIQGASLSEKCNGIDDDCDCPGDTNGDGIVCGPGDLNVDEDFQGLGDPCCSPCNGTIVCNVEGDGTVCDGFGPCEETCNARDDDCDGLIDEGLTCPYELCNGVDDDMDGLTDELPLPGVGQACGSDVGECALGVTCCNRGAVACCGADTPTPEVCDCKDNDCNGRTDESGSRLCYSGPLSECPDPESGACNGVCRPGIQVCTTTTCPAAPGYGPCVGDIGPRTEVCNCLDDDCNGVVDDGATCPNGAPCTNCGCPNVCDPASEFPCPAGYVCSGTCPGASGLSVCVPNPCMGKLCEPAESCDPCSGKCVDSCGGVTCEAGETCCAGACCASWEACRTEGGHGVPRCVDMSCTNPSYRCPTGQVCAVHTCISDPCEDAECGTAEGCLDGQCFPVCPSCQEHETCVEGGCVSDACHEASCLGANLICCDGRCQNDACATLRCEAGEYCDGCVQACKEDTCARVRCPQGYRCSRGQCQPPGNIPTLSTDVAAAGSGGCSCSVNAERTAGRGPAMAMLAAFLVVGSRRRARKPSFGTPTRR